MSCGLTGWSARLGCSVAKVTWGDPPPGVKVYPTEKATWTRIEALQKHGYWPGAVQVEGGWYLTVDPPVAAVELDAHGYQVGPGDWGRFPGHRLPIWVGSRGEMWHG
jgi:hypothetical protein